jgi:hypothetical protein
MGKANTFKAKRELEDIYEEEERPKLGRAGPMTIQKKIDDNNLFLSLYLRHSHEYVIARDTLSGFSQSTLQ